MMTVSSPRPAAVRIIAVLTTVFGLIAAAAAQTAPEDRAAIHEAVQKAQRQSSLVSVSMSPVTASLKLGQRQQFVAVVLPLRSQSVTWTIEPAIGSISADGWYTAPSTPPSVRTVTVKATSLTDSAASATAAVTLDAGIVVNVSPAAVSLGASQTQMFAAWVSGAVIGSVRWSVQPSVGSVSAQGLYAAPASLTGTQIVTLTATSTEDPTRSGTATLTLTGAPPAPPPAPATLTLTPTAASMQPLQRQQFDATVTGATGANITWKVQGFPGGDPSVGTITSGGVYTAPARAPAMNPVYVEAVAGAPVNQTARALITVQAAAASVSVSVSPATAKVATGLTVQMSASVTGASNPGVTWSVNGMTGGNTALGTISSSGLYSAPSAVPSPATVTVTAKSLEDSSKSDSAALTVYSEVAALSINATSLPGGTLGTAYSSGVTATGGTTPYAFSITSGTLPAGLTMSAAGTISGTPTTAATSSFTVQVRDAGGQTATRAFSVVVAAAPTQVSIVTASLPGGTGGTAYSATLAATGGTAPYTWTVLSGLLPPGVSLITSTGALSGTPTTGGTYNMTVQVRDALGQLASKSFSLVVATTLAITTTTLPQASMGVAYLAAVAAAGNGTLAWAVDSGQLPPGLTLNPTSGAIAGTPTTAGSYSFSIRVQDAGGQFVSRPFTIPVQASGSQVAVLTNSLHMGYLRKAYDAVLKASGGTAPYTWSLSTGQLPAGMTLDAGTGKITGTPTQGGVFTPTLAVRDSTGATGTKAFSLEVFEYATDQYGGMTAKPCPAGPKPRFYTQKIGSRWHLCTPAGNAFWMNGVYNAITDGVADYQGINTSAFTDAKYANGLTRDARLNKSLAIVTRLQSWGFNTLAEYSYAWLRPVSRDRAWGTQDSAIPVKLPFVLQFHGSLYAMQNRSSYAGQPTKDLIAGVKESVYSSYRSVSGDFWDPNFTQYIDAFIANEDYIQDAVASPDGGYLLSLTVDDTDHLQGFGAGPDFPTVANGVLSPGKDQPHLGWVVLVTASTQTANAKYGKTYSDTTVYSKRELGTWLSARYGGNISALNTAWRSNYTTFASAGGWGVGTGVLDEDGTCPARTSSCWVPTDYRNLTGASAQMIQDLNDFLFRHASHYFSTIKGVIRARAPGVLYSGPTTLGTWGTPARRQILEAASQYVDVIGVASIPPNCSNCTDIQQRIDFIAQHGADKPWINWDGYRADADSYMSPYAGGTDQLKTQAARGQLYSQRMQKFVDASSGGTYHFVGLKWWELYDNRRETTNWGLLTRRDNPYDGFAASTSEGADSWGYPTGCLLEFGCERGNYGDFITPVRQANIEALTTTVDGGE